MEIIRTELDGVVEIHPTVHGDHRGWFSESYSASGFAAAGLPDRWVQDNESLSARCGTVRGIHFQTAPHAQNKLLRVIQGAAFDVAVDLRKSSPTFGKWVGVKLTAERRNQILVPAGFGHGFCTLEPNTIVSYKVSAPYAPECDRGVRWDDPDVGIAWPLPIGVEPVISDRDASSPLLAQSQDLFD